MAVAQATSKAAKIWRRTVVGGFLAAVVVALLFLASWSEDGLPIALFALVLVPLCLVEAVRMGKLRGRDLEWVVPAAGVATLFLLLEFVVHAAAHRAAGQTGVRASYLSEALLVATLAGAGFVALRIAARGGIDRRWSRMGVAALLVLVAYLGSTGFYDVAPAGRDVLLVLAAVGTGFAARSLEGARPTNVLIAIGLVVWIAVPLPWLWHVWDRFGTGGLVALVVLSKVGDIAGYYGGNAFGRRHPFPNLSPGKTTEGCLASLLAGIGVGGVLGTTGVIAVNPDTSGLVAGLFAGLLVNVAAQAGDLLESRVKRAAGVKDSSELLGPSGGLLDAVDSLFLTVPMAALAWPLLGVIGPS